MRPNNLVTNDFECDLNGLYLVFFEGWREGIPTQYYEIIVTLIFGYTIKYKHFYLYSIMLRKTFYISVIIMAFSFYSCRASDTLTRLEVYNFSVGDTFDYRHHGHSDDNFGGIIENYTSFDTFSRQVVTGIYWSTDSAIKYIVQRRLFPATVNFDTVILTNPSGYEILIDTELGGARS